MGTNLLSDENISLSKSSSFDSKSGLEVYHPICYVNQCKPVPRFQELALNPIGTHNIIKMLFYRLIDGGEKITNNEFQPGRTSMLYRSWGNLSCSYVNTHYFVKSIIFFLQNT